MRMWLHDGIWLKGDEAQHHLTTRSRPNLNTRKDVVLRHRISFDKIL